MTKQFSLLLFSLFFAANLALAQSLDLAKPSSLAATMKEMSIRLKTTASQATDPSKNSNSVRLATEFVQYATYAKDFTPDTVATLPAAQQPAKLSEYRQMLDGVISSGKELSQAFSANDNAKAVNLLRQLADEKSKGHDAFK